MGLDKDEIEYLSVGGGAGVYIVTAYEGGVSLHVETGPATREVVMMTVGGQPADFPSNSVVNEATAIKAALTYLDRQELDPDLSWRRQ